MNKITISTENSETYSSISNFFIDYYMTDANGEFVKVYLYLIRLLGKESQISVAEIADHFSLTENDICRAIKYWISKNVLRLNYDGRGRLSGIVLLPLSPQTDLFKVDTDAVSILHETAQVTPIKAAPKAAPTVKEAPAAAAPAKREVPAKPKFTAEAMEDLMTDEDFQSIVYQVETLFAKQISARDADTLQYIYDTLHFSVDLFEYLIEYCTSIGKKNCRYMESVAIAWYEDNITTRAQAKERCDRTNALIRDLYRMLDVKRSRPLNLEMDFINHWTKELLFTDDVIKAACEKAIITRPSSVNFPYINGILEDWHKKNVRTLKDVEKESKDFAEKKAIEKAARSKGAVISNIDDFKQTNMAKELSEMEELFLKEVNN